jgi:hypothetical protein
MDTVHEDRYTFMTDLAEFILEWEMFWTKVLEKIKTHILCSIIFFRKSCHLCDNAEKYCTACQITDDQILHALFMLNSNGYRHTLRICNTYHFSTATMITWTHFVAMFTRTLPVLLYFVIFTYINMSFALLCYVTAIICSLYILQLHFYCPIWCLSVSTIESAMFYHHLHLLQSHMVYMSVSLCYFISIISLNDIRQVL